jgi:hypothetical protein
LAGKFATALLAGGVGSIFLLIVLAWVSRYVKHNDTLTTIALGLGMLGQFLAASSLFALLVEQATSLGRTWFGHSSFAIRLAEREMSIYEPFLSRLARFDQADLLYVTEHLAWQQEAFDRRRHGLAGPVEKIGIMPFAIAAMTTAPQIFNALRNVGPKSVQWSILGLVGCFFSIAWLTRPHSTRLERTAWVIKWAADQRNDAETKNVTAV